MRLIQGGRWPSGLLLAATAPVLGSPIAPRSAGPWLAIDSDFPDPGFVQGDDGAWYAFGTNGNGRTVQVATSPDFESWTLLDKEAMPTLAGWETAVDHWAPDVVQRVWSRRFFVSKPKLFSGGGGQ